MLYDGEDEIAGVNSAYVATAPLVGRPFWMYRRFVRAGMEAAAEADLFTAAFDELARGSTAGGPDPLGLCVIIADPALFEANPGAEWPEAASFAGYPDDGGQVRIRYFEGANNYSRARQLPAGQAHRRAGGR